MIAAADDPHDLARFVAAQAEPGAGHAVAMRELAAGAKRSHWMWYVFPQLRGLGMSATAQHYGLAGQDEARAYARHPLLGERLRACTRLVLALPDGASAEQVFGGIDALKMRSCMTLFERADAAEPAYAQVLQRLYAGRRCERTRAMLGGEGSGPSPAGRLRRTPP
jgi:uncharacterized protein (DUF1810 family)